jgi:NADH-quinone oxidoreductase subunit M
MGMSSLFATLLLPLLGAIAILLVRREQVNIIRNTSLGVSILTFLASIPLFFAFDRTNPGFQFVVDVPWVHSLDIGIRLGLDGMSLLPLPCIPRLMLLRSEKKSTT